MWNLQNIYDYYNNIDFDKLVRSAIAKFENEILTLNENQMLLRGEDSDGNQLKTYKAAPGEVYSAYTIALKKEKGQRTDIVTLQDSGYFHQSMELYKDSENLPLLVNGMYPIIADFKKGAENIADNLDVSNVLGLTDENKDIILKLIQNEILSQVAEIIQNQPTF